MNVPQVFGMRLTVLPAAVLLFGAVAACGGSDNEATDKDSTEASARCRLLDASDRETLAGLPVDKEAPVGSKTAGEQCRWTASGSKVIIETTTAKSTEWVSEVGPVMDQYESTGAVISADDKRELAAARAVLARGTDISADEACGVFTTLAELGGAPEDSEFIINYVPLTTDTLAISGQTCTQGQFTSVVLTRPDLEQSAEVEDAIERALETAHSSALAKD